MYEKHSDTQDQLVQTAVLKTVFHTQTVEERDLRMNDRLDLIAVWAQLQQLLVRSV